MSYPIDDSSSSRRACLFLLDVPAVFRLFGTAVLPSEKTQNVPTRPRCSAMLCGMLHTAAAVAHVPQDAAHEHEPFDTARGALNVAVSGGVTDRVTV